MGLGVIIMGAGKGTRMRSSLTKVMHPLAGLPMINHVLNAVLPLSPEKVCAIVGPHNQEEIKDTVLPFNTVLQKSALGTADAVKSADTFFSDFTDGTVLILNGDTPLITTETLYQLIETRKNSKATIALLGFVPQDPTGYGRIITDGDVVNAIVEDKEATPQQKAVEICYSGVMAVKASVLFDLISNVDNNNAKEEYYLTDIVKIAQSKNQKIVYSVTDEQEVMGCDSKIDLATAESIWQYSRRMQALAMGTYMSAPETVYFSWDTQIGNDVSIEPNVVFGEGVVLEDNVTIRAFSHLEECIVRNNAVVGPYARLRPGSDIGEKAKVGNFVEIKNSVVGQGAKVNHLSYVGDADIGADSNLGAGTITCNYDGFRKMETVIGQGVFVGSNSALVAPLRIGDGAIIGAGSVVTKDVEKDALVVARANQENHENAAVTFRTVRQNNKKEG